MKEKEKSLLDRFFEWREKHIPQNRFVLILSFLVGVVSALAAFTLKHLIEFIQELLTSGFSVFSGNWLYLIYPVIGIFFSGLFIRKIVRDDISHGVTKVLYAISRRKGQIKSHNMWSSLVASGVTIGFGGSVGAESPIVFTGAAIGSNLGNFFRMEKKVMMLLLGCGAAGAIAGIFKAPIAGLVFTLEVLMLDLTMSSLLPLLISSVTAATLAYMFTGTDAMFDFQPDKAFEITRVHYVVLLGVVCGLISLYFTHVTTTIEKHFRRIENPYKKLIIGGSILSALIFLFPTLRRRLPHDKHAHQRFRSVRHPEQFVLLWLSGTVAVVHAIRHTVEGRSIHRNQLWRRLWRYIRTQSVPRLHCRLSLLVALQPIVPVDRPIVRQFCTLRNGSTYVRRIPCATYRSIPHRGAYRRIRTLPAVNDSICKFIPHSARIRQEQHLCRTTCTTRRTYHPPQRPSRPHYPESIGCH